MKRVILIAACFAALGLAADFKAGLEAYNHGDFQGAVAQWQPLAESGDAHAQYNLGLMYAAGKGVKQDYHAAVDWYRKAAGQGVPAAQYNLGVIYADGQGVPADPAEAVKWFRMAADQGIPNALLGLGNVYYEAPPGFRNYTEAASWFKQAADKGIASAAFSLGVMYDLGQGVPQSYPEAIKWYQKAADAAYGPAMVNLGVLYYNGQGVKRDLIQAYAWFSRGLKYRDPRSAELMPWVTEKLKPHDMKKAETLAASWQPAGAAAPRVDTSHYFKPPPTAESAATAPATSPAAADTADRAMPASTKLSPANAPATTAPATSAPAAVSGAETPVMPASTKIPPASAPATAAPASPAPAAPAAPAKIRQEQPAPQDVPDEWTNVARVIAVGDVHGDYEQLVAVLESAGLIDGNGNWTGGRTHLVQIGDVVDRGPESRAVMDLLMKLQKQAAAAGGAVHCLIGNHEAMNIYGDLRYVSPGEFASYLRNPASALREVSYEDYRGSLAERATPDGKVNDPSAASFPGYAEQRAAFGPQGVYGRWIRSHNAIIKIDRTLFVHAGLGPKYANWEMGAINAEVRRELDDLSRAPGGIVTDPEGPLWYDALASGNEAQLQPLVDQLLRHFDVDRIVIGHTYANAAITPRFNGKVVLVDIGLSRVYDNVGKIGCLEIDDGRAAVLHRGQKLELPKDENGPDMLRYLRQAAALDPPPSPLLKRISDLEKSR